MDWLPDTLEHGGVESYVESDTPKSGITWIADQVCNICALHKPLINSSSRQIWGFSEIDGARRYTRRVHFTGPEGEDIKVRLVYDYRK